MPDNRSPQFVSGYPQSQRDKSRSRVAISANAARLRWRRSTLTPRQTETISDSNVRDAMVQKGRMTSARNLQEEQQWVALAVSGEGFNTPRESARSFSHPQFRQNIADFVSLPARTFSQSVKNLTLAPSLPVGELDLISNDEIWVILRKVQDGFEQAFPPESNGENPFAAIWMEKVISASEVLYSNIFCQSLREECSDKKITAQKRRLTQLYHSKTVTAINENMQILDAAYSDSNIFAIFALAHHHQFLTEPESDLAVRDKCPSQGPLNSLRLLNVYGSRIEHVSVHAEAFTKIVALRGGIEAIDFPGLSQAASYGELIISCRTLQPPSMKFVPCLGLDLDASLSSSKRKDHPLRDMGRGFDILTCICTSAASWELQLALRRLALYSLVVDDYVAGRSVKESLAVISEQRNFVQHGIMSLLAVVAEENDPVACICLLAGICYSFLCVFPFPAAPFSALLQQMNLHFFSNDFSTEWKQAPHLMVWILYILGVASVGMQEHQTWIIAALDRCFRRLKLDSWKEVKLLLLDFIWLPITNDNDGIALWERIETSNPFRFPQRMDYL